MQRPITRGAAANAGLIFHIFAQDSASTVGAGKASVAFSSWSCRYIRSGEAISGAITPEDITTIGTYAAPTAATNIRIKAVDNTNMIGVYEIQLHLDWVNTTNNCQSLTIYLTASGVAVLPIQIPLGALDTQLLQATPTNITAGTITTVTNLTNAPTAGDLTATMKTSVQTAATASLAAFFTSAAQLVTDIWASGTRTLTAFDASFKTGYALSSAGVQAIWDALTSALTTVGSVGKLLVDNVNATISSRSSHSAADVWAVGSRTLTAFDASFKTGYALSSAGVQAIWDAATSALTTVGSIGKLLVDRIDAAISSRFAAASAPTNFSSLLINASGHVSRVTLVDTTTLNIDMRGTDNAALAATALSTVQWTNTRAGYLDNLNALKIKKNAALANFTFLMVLSSDHITPATGKTITATRSIDGAAFGACANAVSEVANGVYKINLAATDLNGDTITLKFTEATCDQRTIVIATQP